MKKILGLGLAALLVMAMVGGGTWAYFSDTESSTGNTLSAGTLDLQVSTDIGAYGNTPVLTYTANLTKPDGTNSTGYSKIKNAGTLDASNLKVTATAITPAIVTAITGDSDITQDAAYLPAHAKMSLYIDAGVTNSWGAGDIGLKSDGTLYNYGTGSGGGATATTNASGTIISIGTIVAGSGYTASATEMASVTNGSGTGAIVTATISVGGAVTAFNILNGGSGYGVSTTFPVTVVETASVTSGVYMAVMNDYASKTWSTGPLLKTIAKLFCITYQFPDNGNADDNAAQGTSAAIDFIFDLVQ